jgi:hypothetical protein
MVYRRKPQPPNEPLHNGKHERFANLRATGTILTTAYKQAGYKSGDPGQARRLAQNPPVRDRIQWIKNSAGERTNVDLDYLVAAASRVLTKAEALQQMTAAVGAIKELGILTGHRIEKREQTLKTNPDEMTDAELLIIAGRGRPQLEAKASNDAIIEARRNEPMTEERIERAIEQALSLADVDGAEGLSAILSSQAVENAEHSRCVDASIPTSIPTADAASTAAQSMPKALVKV